MTLEITPLKRGIPTKRKSRVQTTFRGVLRAKTGFLSGGSRRRGPPRTQGRVHPGSQGQLSIQRAFWLASRRSGSEGCSCSQHLQGLPPGAEIHTAKLSWLVRCLAIPRNFRISLSIMKSLLGFWLSLCWLYRSIWEILLYLTIKHKQSISLHLFSLCFSAVFNVQILHIIKFIPKNVFLMLLLMEFFLFQLLMVCSNMWKIQ